MAKTTKTTGTMGTLPLGMGITQTIDGERLILALDLSGNFGPSGSGKSRKVATTGGNVTVCGGLKLGINAYDPDLTRDLKGATFPVFSDVALGRNVVASLGSNGTLTLVIDTSQDLGPSSTGKSRTVATTNGNVTLPLGLKLGLNCFDPIPAPRV